VWLVIRAENGENGVVVQVCPVGILIFDFGEKGNCS
jgi:hypothetical protein